MEVERVKPAFHPNELRRRAQALPSAWRMQERCKAQKSKFDRGPPRIAGI